MALIFSGALNIALLTVVIVSSFDDPLIPAMAGVSERQASMQPANRELLAFMLTLSFPELATYLTNKEPVEEGYAKRDLALSALKAAHHFDLNKALSFAPIQRRTVSLGQDLSVEMYPGLSEEQYASIIRFAYQEKWPLTARGLFQLLQKWPKQTRDPSLMQAFFVTAEFHTLETLFRKTGAPQNNEVLLDLICEGSWDDLEQLSYAQAQTLDLSVEKRRSLLLGALSRQSSTAAKLLLDTDFVFVKLQLDDAKLMDLLSLLNVKTDVSERFCMELLRSPRSDALLRVAAEKLYTYAQETVPVPFDLLVAAARFAPSETPAAVLPRPSEVPSQRSFREYVVKEGDTLWKIARLHKIKVDALVEANGIETEKLFPGMMLRIPNG